MIFDLDFQPLRIIDVLALDQKDVDIRNVGRHFHALSFRSRSDAVLEANTQRYNLTDNALCFVPQGTYYRRTASIDQLIAIHFHTAANLQNNIMVYTPQAPEMLQALFQQLLQCWEQKLPGYRYQCTSILYEIFGICHACFGTPKQATKISPAISYIQKNWNDPQLSVSKVAEQAFISEVYFRKLFRREMGVSPKRYIIDLRMQNAISLLDSGYFSMQEVADQCGYADYKYFSVEFKRYIGCTPSEYAIRQNKNSG